MKTIDLWVILTKHTEETITLTDMLLLRFPAELPRVAFG